MTEPFPQYPSNWNPKKAETPRKKIGWTKLERVTMTGRHARTMRATFPRTCYLCNGTIPPYHVAAVVNVQARAYRSIRDIGDTSMTVRICGACIFPNTTPEAT